MRYFKELFNPKLKCKRLGHKKKTIKQKIRKESSGYYVVEDFVRETVICKRCGQVLSTKKDKYLDGYTSCSMPSDMWDELKMNGFLVMSKL